MGSKDLQPRLVYPAKLSFGIEGHIKSFPIKKKLKEFINTKTGLYEMLKGFLEEERGGGERDREKIKNMKNQMAINIYLSTIKSKKQNK